MAGKGRGNRFPELRRLVALAMLVVAGATLWLTMVLLEADLYWWTVITYLIGMVAVMMLSDWHGRLHQSEIWRRE